MSHNDLREWITQVDRLGQLKVLEDAHWDLEIGVITEEVMRRQGPAILFDRIADFPPGYRVLVNSLGSAKRMALTLGLPLDVGIRELLSGWREKLRDLKPIPAKYVEDGPVLEEMYFDEAVDMLKFPAPKWHEHDGGRYIGTGSVDITKDPDDGWVNVGCYRVMVHDKGRVGFYIDPGKHGRMHRDKWLRGSELMPVAVSFGHDPAIFFSGGIEVPYGICEYDWVGGLKGEPVEVIRGPVTGLPIPANAEIVIEGYVNPSEQLMEGPFGEWTGYYASGRRPEPFIEVKGLYHRTDPIILGSAPAKPPAELSHFRAFLRAAAIHEQLEKAGLTGISGVWCHEVGGSRLFTVVAMQQLYAGHAKQVGTVASQCQAGAFLGRFVVVVDDDIDVMDLNDVMWAVCTRVEPASDIDILHHCWSGPLDLLISPERKEREEFYNSRAILDATRPFEWRDQFPLVAESSPEIREKFLKKWGDKLGF
jgi:4-hydroxy-3-polyprenylbenzoate decarboxylase